MSTLLQQPGFAASDSVYRQRRRFKLLVFIVLVTSALVLAGALLIKISQDSRIVPSDGWDANSRTNARSFTDP